MSEQTQDPRESIDSMCSCGHPQQNHCASFYPLDDGRVCAEAGHGSCLRCESEFINGDIKEEQVCEKFVWVAWIFKGDENYKRFKHLYEEDEY